MARGTRLDAPGAIHHVVTRGIQKSDIFLDDEDRDAFLEYLTRALRNSTTHVLAWALMANHVHILFRTGDKPLSRVMQLLGTCYARHFNRRWGRSGYVFQGRYRSFLVQEDAYLLAAVRYVHSNPIEAGIVASLEELAEYPWTGHPALVGRPTWPFQATCPVLSAFHDDRLEAQRRLLEWMRGRVGEDYERVRMAARSGDEKAALMVVSGPPVHRDASSAGSPLFAVDVMKDLSESRARAASLKRLWPLDRLVAYVCGSLGVDPADVREGSRKRNVVQARSAIAYLAHKVLDLPLAAMTEDLGVSTTSLSRGIEPGRKVVAANRLRLE